MVWKEGSHRDKAMLLQFNVLVFSGRRNIKPTCHEIACNSVIFLNNG